MIVIHTPTLVHPNELNPAAFNPRTISAQKFDALKASIIAHGFTAIITVQKKGMGIIGGHQSVRAVKEISIEACEQVPKLPCIVLDIEDEQAKKLNIKLNAIRGDFEARMLGELLIDIYEEPKHVDADEAMQLGFTQEEVYAPMYLVEPSFVPTTDDTPNPKTFGKSLTLSLEFSNVETRDRVKKLLVSQAKTAKKKTGDLIAAMFKKSPKPKAKTLKRRVAA